MGVLLTLLVLVGLVCTLASPVWGTCAYIATLIIRPNEWVEGVMVPAVPIMMIAVALSTALHAGRALPQPPPPPSKSPRLMVLMVLLAVVHLVIWESLYTPRDWILSEGGPTLLLMYYLTRHMATPGRLAAALGATTASATVHAVDAFFAHYFRRAAGPGKMAEDPDGTVFLSHGKEWDQYHLHGLRLGARGSTIWSNPNDFGMLINWAMAGYLYLFRRAGNKLWNLLSLALMVILAWTLLLTGSRGGQLQLAITGWMVFVGGRRKVLGIILLVGALAALLVVLPVVAPERGDETASKDERTELAKASLRLFTWKPITGVGFYRSRWLNDYKSLMPHNVYVQCLAETGLIGSSIFFALIYLLRRETSRAVKYFEGQTASLEQRNTGTLARCLGAMQLAFTVFIAFSNQFMRFTFGLVMSLAMGLYRAMQLARAAEQEQPPDQQQDQQPGGEGQQGGTPEAKVLDEQPSARSRPVPRERAPRGDRPGTAADLPRRRPPAPRPRKNTAGLFLPRPRQEEDE
jgi:hypothetical protein